MSIIADSEASIGDRRSALKKFIDGLEAETGRMRKDRDNMRELYEHANAQVASANRNIINLQALLSKFEEKTKIGGQQNTRLQDIINCLHSIKEDPQGDLAKVLEMIQDNESHLYQELEELLAVCMKNLEMQNKAFLQQISEKEESIGKVLREKLRAEFSLVQVKKDTELEAKKAAELERLSLERLEAAEAREREARAHSWEADNRIMRRLLEAERAAVKLTDIMEENARLQRLMDSSSSKSLETALAENSDKLGQAIFENKRLIEEIDLLKVKLKSYADAGGIPQHELEAELGMYKKLMKCNSCHVRDKNAVINKMHACLLSALFGCAH